MRTLLKWTIGLEAGNEAIRTGKIAEITEAIMAVLQPEAVYFGTENGCRTGYVFFDLTDPSQIPVIAEPMFQHLHSSVEFIPVMNAEDLQRGLSEAAKAWAP